MYCVVRLSGAATSTQATPLSLAWVGAPASSGQSVWPSIRSPHRHPGLTHARAWLAPRRSLASPGPVAVAWLSRSPALLERFRQDGADAEPVVIGARRRPEAVVLSYERYLKLAGGRQRVAAALEQQAREAGETLDAEDAMELANNELHAMRRQRRAP